MEAVVKAPLLRFVSDFDLLHFLLFLRFATQSLRDALIPSYHMAVWFAWEAFSGKDLGECLSTLHVFHIPPLDRLPQEVEMLVRTQQYLNRLPHDPPFRLECRHRWIRERSRMSVMGGL
jgi:hypothetical protein